MKKVLRQTAVSAVTGISESTLEKMRFRGDGPPFVKLGARAVGYLEDDVERWLEARRRFSTSDQGMGSS